MKQMDTKNLQFQQRNKATIQSMQTQIGQLENAISHNQSQASNSLTFQPILNPNANGKNVSAIALKYEKKIEELAQQEESNNEGAKVWNKERT